MRLTGLPVSLKLPQKESLFLVLIEPSRDCEKTR
jgi:hypothetical protein